jgi:hypothetical protein
MKIQKKTVTIDREELEALAKQVAEFEKVVKTFERLEATGKLAPDFQRQWNSTKKFLSSEETRIAGTSGTTRELRKKRCCKLLGKENETLDCRETNTRYSFALAACVLAALSLGANAQLSAGSCASLGGCP